MDTNRTFKDIAIVIRENKYANTSKICSLFTRTRGKISLMAKGANRKSSPLFSLTRLFSVSELSLTKSGNFYYIVDGEVVDNNFHIASDMRSFVITSIVADLLTKLIQEDLADSDVFDMTMEFLKVLKEKEIWHLGLLMQYLLKLMSFMGYMPNLSSCLSCGKKLEEAMVFNPELGGLICKSCRTDSFIYEKLTKNEINLLRKFLYLRFSQIKNEKNSAEDSSVRKVTYIVLSYFNHVFDLDTDKIIDWLSRTFILEKY